MKINSDGELVGSKREIVHFKMTMFVWRHKKAFLVVFEVLCFMPFFFHSDVISFLPTIVFFILVLNTKFDQFGIFGWFKKQLLVDGMMVSVPKCLMYSVIYDVGSNLCVDFVTSHKGFTFGVYKMYNSNADIHIVQRPSGEYAYEFKDISPLYWPECYRTNQNQ